MEIFNAVAKLNYTFSNIKLPFIPNECARGQSPDIMSRFVLRGLFTSSHRRRLSQKEKLKLKPQSPNT